MAAGSVDLLLLPVRHWDLSRIRVQVTVSMQWNVPKNDNESIEEVHATLDIGKWTIGQDLQDHLQSKETTEEQVAVFEYHRQRIGLQIVFLTRN